MKIRIARPEGYEFTHRVTGHHHFPQGDYAVPDQMPADIARACLNSGIGAEIADTAKRETKTKKKRRSTKAGKGR